MTQKILTLVFPILNSQNGLETKISVALAPAKGEVEFANEKIARCGFPEEAAPESIQALYQQCPALEDFGADSILQTATPGGIKVAFFDMDSTIVQAECIDQMALQVDVKRLMQERNLSAEEAYKEAKASQEDAASCYAQVAAITHGSMYSVNRGSFTDKLKARIDLIVQAAEPFGGFTEEDVKTCISRIQPMEGTRELLKHLKENGVKTALVSGGFMPFVEHFGRELGIDECYGNQLRFEDGKLAEAPGHEEFGIIDGAAKLAVVREVTADLGCGLENAMFTGDGSNDAPPVAAIAQAGGVGIAFLGEKSREEISPALAQAANGFVKRLASLIQLPLREVSVGCNPKTIVR